ncbi:hypothetical protein [Kitasatospora camelliae]|uniref:Uncharacterized protein n=1 Tax=Kitasatospora camelliae TaxID=3156397 RepID=A0AAU8JNP5_9ACTN
MRIIWTHRASSAYAFAVYFPEIGRSTACATVPAYGDHTYTYLARSTEWQIRAC